MLPNNWIKILICITTTIYKILLVIIAFHHLVWFFKDMTGQVSELSGNLSMELLPIEWTKMREACKNLYYS